MLKTYNYLWLRNYIPSFVRNNYNVIILNVKIKFYLKVSLYPCNKQYQLVYNYYYLLVLI